MGAWAAPPVPAGWLRYADPSTEGEVFRLTDPRIESWMPALPARAVSRRVNTLLFAQKLDGRWQPCTMDLSRGGVNPVAAPDAMDPQSLTLSADDRSALYFTAEGLESANIGRQRTQIIYRFREGWKAASAVVPSEDGMSLWFVESASSTWALRRLRAPKWAAETVVESASAIHDPAPNPRRAQILYRREGGGLSTATFDGKSTPSDTPPGRVIEAGWSPDGNEIEYLLEPAEPGRLVELRERSLDERTDKLIAKTSQFAGFARNGNASVFVGASRNKASATVLLLLRRTRREFTLCEHKAKDPTRVNARFTPDSQKVLFQTDRDGNAAIYLVNVEKLVEKTES
jgi:oligogalacturonide lyase